MKMMILPVAAAALIGAAAPGPPAHYQASGFEPDWVIDVNGPRMTINPGTSSPPIIIRSPRWRAVRNGYRYSNRGLIVDVRHVRCEAYGGGVYPDTVTLIGLGGNGDGCGGIPIPPRSLAEQSFSVRSIDNVPLEDDAEYQFEFSAGRLHGQAGCSQLNGSYRERRPILTLGTITVTHIGCRDPGTASERRVVAVMRGALRMRFVEGDTLVLTGPGGTIRMR